MISEINKMSNGIKINTSEEKIKELLERRVEKVIVQKDLEKKLFSGKRLRIKFGVDPSRPDIHLGHTVPLRKLKEFQKLGHQVVFIIGDFTGQIGDPSGKSKTRVQLSAKEVDKNAETYLKQVGKIIDTSKIEIRRNSQWYKKMKLDDVIKLAGLVTVARILERDDFTKRMKKNIDIRIHEMLYPILQAYDSIIIKADVEIGGTDQTFNMLMGRTLQKKLDKSLQDVMTVPLLIGLDGKEKMSKSMNNYIGVIENSQEQYGKIMSIPDELIIRYFKLTTDVSLNKIREIERDLKSKKLNPRDAKALLAWEIVKLYHSEEEATRAEKEFNKIFKEHKAPEKIPEIKIKNKEITILDLLVQTKLAKSKGEGRRLVQQGGIKIDGGLIDNWKKTISIKNGMIVQAGKRRFVRIKS